MLSVLGPVVSGPLAGLPQHKPITYPNAVYVQADGAWKTVSEMWTMVGGTWFRSYKTNVNDTAVGNVLSGIVANDREMNDPTMLFWQEFWQNPAGTTERQWIEAESAIKITLNDRNPDGNAATRLGPWGPMWVTPGWRVSLDTMVKGTARFSLGVITAPTYEDCDFFGTGAQWQEGGYIGISETTFEAKTSQFVVPAGHNYVKPYCNAYIQPDQPTGSRTLTVQSFQPVRITP